MNIVRNCMFPNLETLSPSTTLMEAIYRLVNQGPGFAVILENMSLTGLITEFDLLKWIDKGVPLEKTRIGEMKISIPQVVHENTPCQELLKLYNQRKFRRFPVLNEDEMLSGGIMEKQILAALPRSQLATHYRVANILGPNPPILTAGKTYREVTSEMIRYHRGCVLVVKNSDTLIGLVTEGDMLRYRITPEWRPEQPVEAFMTKTPITTIEPEMDLLCAMDFFRQCGHRRLPIQTKEGRLVGLLTQTDLLRQMTLSTRSRQAVLNPEDITEPAIWFEPFGEHRILEINGRAALALGLNPEQWVGQSVHPFNQNTELWAAIILLVKHCGTIERLKMPLQTHQGQCVTSRFSLIHTPTGEDRIFWTLGNMETDSSACR
ncbi:MAG: CBS domain-containing protein [Magnetococcus sp. DMHC-6]